MTYYCGIDLHSSNSVVVIIDEADKIVFKKRLRNELGLIVAALAPYQEALSGVRESIIYLQYY